MYVSIMYNIINFTGLFSYALCIYANTINTIYCHHDDEDNVVLPDGTDGPIRTLYGSRDGEIMVHLKKDSALLSMALSHLTPQLSAVDRSAASYRVVEAQERMVERIGSPEDTPVSSDDSTLMGTSILRRGIDDLDVSRTTFFAGSKRLLSGGDVACIEEREEETYSIRSDALVLLVDSGGDDLICSGVLRFGTPPLLVNKLLSKKLELALSWVMMLVLEYYITA
jgi:hypothetical protein